MDKAEVDTFFEKELLTRWQQWDPSGAEINDWSYKLKNYDYNVCRDAVREHYIQSKLRRPRLLDILGYCRNNARRTEDGTKLKFKPTVFIQCIQGRAPGCYHPIIFGRDIELNQDEQVYIAAAEKMVYGYAENGEEWMVCVGDEKQVRERRRELARRPESAPERPIVDEQVETPAEVPGDSAWPCEDDADELPF